MTEEPAPVCTGSGHQQSIDMDLWTVGSQRKICHVCGQEVRFRVRGTDLPPYGQVGPHRTDGTRIRWSDVAKAAGVL